MLAKQGLILFLVETNSYIKGSLPIYAVPFALNDFIEQYKEESIKLRMKDYEEIDKIKQDPYFLVESYLFSKIEPFLLPFYERKRDSTSL